MEILEESTLQKKCQALPLLNVAAYWKSSNTDVCARRLSQILTNNIDNEGKSTAQNLCEVFAALYSEL